MSLNYEGFVMPYRTILSCPDPGCDWTTDRRHPSEDHMAELAWELGPFDAARELLREAMAAAELEIELHFMEHMRGDV
jgi:hypothetical protein